jgi:hypothetical protein
MMDATETITAYLGAAPTATELAIFADQKARLTPGIFDNPLLPKSSVGMGLVTLPFVPFERTAL